MADTTLQVRFLHPYKTEAQWALVNDIPKSGEILYTSGGDHDGWYKIGDGTHTWSELEYASPLKNAFLDTATLSTNDIPYTFRPMPDSSAKRASTKIVGGTVAWNQLCRASAPSSSGHITINSHTDTSLNFTIDSSATGWQVVPYSASEISMPAGNKFLLSLDYQQSKTLSNPLIVCGGTGGETNAFGHPVASTSKQHVFGMGTVATGMTNGRVFFQTNENNVTIDMSNVMAFDLTTLLGSTIADYLYTLESSSSGSGIAKLREWGIIDGKYHAYDAGSLQSVKVSALESVGFNQWDEEWVNGYYNPSNGAFTSLSNFLASKNKIPVMPSTTYCMYNSKAKAFEVFEYDANDNFLGRPNGSVNNSTFVTMANTRYITFNSRTAGEWTSYDGQICVNVSDPARNGTYEPYHKYTTALDPIEIRGIYKLDASSNLYADGDVYESDGTVPRKYGIRAYQAGDANSDTMITDGTNTVYKLTTPTTESADPYTNPHRVEAGGTEAIVDASVTAGTRDIAVPMGHETKYLPAVTLNVDTPTRVSDFINDAGYLTLSTLPKYDGTVE